MISGELTLWSMSQSCPRGRREARRGPASQFGNWFKHSYSHLLCAHRTVSLTNTLHSHMIGFSPSSHLFPVAVCWRWSIWPGSTSSVLSERTAAFATSQSPSPCLVQAPRRWHLPAGCHRPPCHPPEGKGTGERERERESSGRYEN